MDRQMDFGFGGNEMYIQAELEVPHCFGPVTSVATRLSAALATRK
jgi:hypothetical protein